MNVASISVGLTIIFSACTDNACVKNERLRLQNGTAAAPAAPAQQAKSTIEKSVELEIEFLKIIAYEDASVLKIRVRNRDERPVRIYEYPRSWAGQLRTQRLEDADGLSWYFSYEYKNKIRITVGPITKEDTVLLKKDDKREIEFNLLPDSTLGPGRSAKNPRPRKLRYRFDFTDTACDPETLEFISVRLKGAGEVPVEWRNVKLKDEIKKREEREKKEEGKRAREGK
jgi:hypothetical protein